MLVNNRSVVEILKDSLNDKPHFIGEEDFEEIRYKLIIDATEDDSSRRLLVMFGIVDPDYTKTVVGSDFPDDGDLQKVNNKYTCIYVHICIRIYVYTYVISFNHKHCVI